MPNDQKVGFALGLLLLGIVAAFFFRNPQMKTPDVPELESSAEVDARISEKSVTPYLTGIDTEQGGAVLGQPGDEHAQYGADFPRRREAPHWEVPDFLKNNTAESNENRISNPNAIAPNPIPLVSESRGDGKLKPNANSKTLKYIPDHNDAWETVPPIPFADSSDSNGNSQKSGASDSSRAAAQRMHTVKAGDTLSSIAAQYLGSSSKFERIYEANRDQLKNPNDLRVGMKLIIPDDRRPASNGSERLAVPTDGPSASNSGITSNAKPTSTSDTKPFTRAAVRTPEGHPSPSADSSSDGERSDTTGPRGRFAPAKRSPYRPRSEPGQSSLDLRKLFKEGEPANGPAKKQLTQIPPEDLPLSVEMEQEAETAAKDGEYEKPAARVE